MIKPINETKYCIVLEQAKIRDDNVGYGIEKIFVKELNTEETRFVYFKKRSTTSSKTIRFATRWFNEFIKKNVFSKVINAGNAFGVDVYIFFWIIEKK